MATLAVLALGCDEPETIEDEAAQEEAAEPPSHAEAMISEAGPPPQGMPLLDAAGEAALAGDLQAANALYLEAEASPDAFVAWAATSGRVALARRNGAWDTAAEITAEVRDARPELDGLMDLWDGDTLALAGDVEGALSRYLAVADEHGSEQAAGKPMRAVALRQAARSADVLGDAERAADLRAQAELAAVATDEWRVANPAVCTPATASNGFQLPIVVNAANWGHRFMSLADYGAGNVYHPGADGNGPGDDCDDNIKPVAQGCVSEAFAVSPAVVTDEGAVTVWHYYLPATALNKYWTSAYWHADYVYYSVDAAVTKSSILAQVDNVGTPSCHLHWEIREPDHPDPDDLDYWTGLAVQSNVGKYYADPESWHVAHTSYQNALWADEGAFACSGTWTASTDGDEGDSKWAGTTNSTGTPTAACTYAYVPGTSGTYKLYAHIPWNNATSRSVSYRLYNTGTGVSVMPDVSFDQLTGPTGTTGSGCGVALGTSGELCDEWVYLGSGYLNSGTSYTIKIGNNTGEDPALGRKVNLDDVLLIRQ